MAEAAAARDWRSWIRRDISRVPPLGGYAAKRCPVRTQLDILHPGDRAEVSDFLRSLADRGDQFEAEVFDAMADQLRVIPIATPDRAEKEATTLSLMQAGERLITGGRLPTDLDGRRVGEPDVLVRIGDAPVDGRWRYAPGDIKSHGITKPGSGHPVVIQTMDALAVPGDDANTTDDGRRDATARADLMQLAHYHRMLEACGHAAVGPVWGTIFGSEETAVWFRLDQPLWPTRTSDPDKASRLRSALEVYDFEFGFRLDIAAAAVEHRDDPSAALLVEPMDCAECPECPWRNHCWPQLDRAGDVSRLPGVSYDQWRALRDADLGTIDALAAAPDPTVDGIKDGRLAELQLQARARSGEAPAYLRPGVTLAVPTADVEVDVDMENIAAGAYLWGATVTVRRDDLAGIEAGHHAFSTWTDPLDDGGIRDCFGEFWTWLTDLRASCEAQGATFTAFCWNQSAENRFLRQGGDLHDCLDEVEDFIASEQWVDLMAWFKSSFVTGHGAGLKNVATALGFEWRDEEPGGAASITWYADAVSGEDDATREAARQRLLAYNEDDVRATLAIRETIAAGTWTTPPTP